MITRSTNTMIQDISEYDGKEEGLVHISEVLQPEEVKHSKFFEEKVKLRIDELSRYILSSIIT